MSDIVITTFMEKQTQFNQEIKTDISLIMEKLKNLGDRFEEKFEETRQDNQDIITTMNKFIDKNDIEFEKDRVRLKNLEDWKLVFVAKFSVYSAIALFAGSIVGALITNWINKQL